MLPLYGNKTKTMLPNKLNLTLKKTSLQSIKLANVTAEVTEVSIDASSKDLQSEICFFFFSIWCA